ncbi:MFS transporter [Alteriqipengyuania lutimaris]|uniref:MFS transporter n=1 Tax=Alteriqipengyuania lutimaris TaxID=1538146 RepID=UPI0022796176|nr:MFS transporter [Alteriqipengyuania lutimaris]
MAYICSFIDRMIVSLLVDQIKADLEISDFQISLIQGLAFAIFFTVASIPIGRLIDRVNRTRAIAAGIAAWSAATVACGQASSFMGLFLARMGVGVGEAVLSPAAYSIIADSFPRRRLGLAMGLFGLGSATGAGLAFMIGGGVVALVAQADTMQLPFFGAVRPWQFAFIVAGLPGLLIALAFLFIPDPGSAARAVKTKGLPWSTVFAELRQRAGFYWSVFGGVAAVNLSVLGTVNWLPAMYMRGFQTDLSTTGYIAGVLLIAGGLLGMVGGGAIMDRVGGGVPAARMRFCGWAVAIAIIPAVAFPLVPNIWLAGLLFVAFFTAAAAVVSAAPSVLQELAPEGMRATIAAVYVFVINAVGIGIGASVTAAISDALFPGGDGIRNAMAIVAPFGYAIGAALFFNAAKHARR